MHDNNLEILAGGEPPTGISLHKGFPNAALDYADRGTPLALDLNQLLIRHPISTYLFRIQGDNWHPQGIFDGDIALVDRLPQPRSGDLVLSWQTDAFQITTTAQAKGRAVWGVVTAVIHQYHPPETS